MPYDEQLFGWKASAYFTNADVKGNFQELMTDKTFLVYCKVRIENTHFQSPMYTKNPYARIINLFFFIFKAAKNHRVVK